MNFKVRKAKDDDLERIEELMVKSIDELQVGYLSQEQIVKSHVIMGVDKQLIHDETYFVVETVDDEKTLVGCGGWGKRNAPFGPSTLHNDASLSLLNPAIDLANLRAMYTHPQFARKGIATLMLNHIFKEIKQAGFKGVKCVSTAAGEKFYVKHAFEAKERFAQNADGTEIPLIKMEQLF